METKYFSIHYLAAMKNKQYSIVVANISNTPDKIKKANELFSSEQYIFEFHDAKIDLRVMIC